MRGKKIYIIPVQNRIESLVWYRLCTACVPVVFSDINDYNSSYSLMVHEMTY